MKLNWIIPLFAAAGLALAGCGGGGSSSSSLTSPSGGTTGAGTDDTDTTPTAASVTLPTERPTSYTAPTAGTISLAAGETEDSGSVTFSCPADGEDCEIVVAADGTVTSTGGEATAMLTTAAMAALTLEQTMTAEEMKLRAVGVADALPNAAISTSPVSVTRKTSAAAAFKSTGRTAGDAPTSIGSDWAGATFTGINVVGPVTNTEKVVVYSDIEAPVSAKFGDVYGTNPKHREADRTPYNPTNTDTDRTGTGGDAYAAGVLTITAVSNSQKGLLDATHFPTRNRDRDVTWTYGDGSTDKHPKSFDAKFHGADGTYTCSDTGTCSVTVAAADGAYTFTGTAWTFTPKGSARAMVTDVDHMQFGYWLTTPDMADATGDYNYTVNLIAQGSQPFLNSDVATLTGAARYMGSAAGVFAVKTTEDGVLQSANAGEFVADANLMARFGASPTLEGRIDNFSGGNGVDMTGWSVALTQAPIASDNGTPALATVGAGATRAAASAYMGATTKATSATWSATLQGPGHNNAAPTGVVGDFNAIFANGNIAGAFGARKE